MWMHNKFFLSGEKWEWDAYLKDRCARLMSLFIKLYVGAIKHSWEWSAHSQLFPWGLAADIGAAPLAAQFLRCALWKGAKADVLSSDPLWLAAIFDAVCQREFTRGSGNKTWHELRVNCQGTRALLQPELCGSGAGTIPPSVHSLLHKYVKLFGRKTWHHSVNGQSKGVH